MENKKLLEVLEAIKKYGVCYNGTIKVGEIIDLIEGQQAEIERLTKLAELRKKDNDDTCKLLFEAGKQVDELTERAEIVEEIANTYQSESTTKCWVDYAVKQAVKDTAKEIGIIAIQLSNMCESFYEFQNRLIDLIEVNYSVEIVQETIIPTNGVEVK